MKLKNSANTFNLGDTSFRRKTLIDDYKTILPILQKTNLDFPIWNNESQAEFYKSVLLNTNLFNDRDMLDDPAKRGRTLTNALTKIGLIDEHRKLSTSAIKWIKNTNLPADEIESLFDIDINNLIFVRQLLKLRVYDSDGLHYFYPFRVALELLKMYTNIPQQDFLTIIHLITPKHSDSEIKKIINNYSKVKRHSQRFGSFLAENFPENKENLSAESLFSTFPLNREQFNELFVNRKSSSIQNKYYEFVNELLLFKNTKSAVSLQKLIKISRDSSVKKAFGNGRKLFLYEDRNPDKFMEKNKFNPFLAHDNSLIYERFIFSKKRDIVREYSDMTKRTFNLTGLIDFGNRLVNAVNRNLFTIVFNDLTLSGIEDCDNYESNLSQCFYQENTISEILDLDKNSILEKIHKKLGIIDPTELKHLLAMQKESKFRKHIKNHFSKEKIIKILPLFSTRQDSKIKELVSESATVPTIFEYIVAIAWFYISEESFNISKSLNLTLDGNMLPLTQAPGGSGDIIIDYKNLTLMLEVTLMNTQAQKRGEWEPVLRHAINLTIDEAPKNVITLFIADELDENTINIWNAVARVPLKSSNKDKTTDLVKIFPLKNNELLEMLEQGRTEKNLLPYIDDYYEKISGNFNLNWRSDILSKMKNQNHF